VALIAGATKVANESHGLLDVEVGQRVRAFRVQKGLSQQKLADQLGITFQQVQKYENGADRIGAGRLQAIAAALGVPIYDFFTLAGQRAAQPNGLINTLDNTAALRLLRAYLRIREPELQQAIMLFVESIAGGR
jgi:transcriptional regulator with XRE-family HTH domain